MTALLDSGSEGNMWLEVRIPTRAARIDLHGVRQQVVRLAGGAVQGPATRMAQALKPGYAGGIRTCSVHQSHSGLSSQVRSCSTCGAHKHTTPAASVGQGMLFCDGRDISKRSCLGLAAIDL